MCALDLHNYEWQYMDTSFKHVPKVSFMEHFGVCKDVACTNSNTAIVAENGTIWVSGRKFISSIYDDYIHSYRQIGSKCDFVKVALSLWAMFGIDAAGKLWTIGTNKYNAMGLGTAVADTFVADDWTQVGSDTDWEAIYCTDYVTIAEKTNGYLYGAGRNHYGQLGLGNTSVTKVFTQIPNSNNHSKVSLNFAYTAILKNDGTIWVCGKNTYVFGYGKTLNAYYTSLAAITTEYTDYTKGNRNFIDMCAYTNNIQGIKDDQAIYVLGLPTYGVFGADISLGLTGIFTHVQTGLDYVTKLCGSNYKVFARNLENGVHKWYATGRNYEYSLGLGLVGSPYAFTYIPGIVTDEIKSTEDISMYVDSASGKPYGVGYNDYGQLGMGIFSNYTYIRYTTFTLLTCKLREVRRTYVVT